MPAPLESIAEALRGRFGETLRRRESACGELGFDLDPADLLDAAAALRDEEAFSFAALIDVCGVDYLGYGQAEWRTERSTEAGFSRAVDSGAGAGGGGAAEQGGGQPASGSAAPGTDRPGRFAAVYHLLSLRHNARLRLRVFAQGENPPLLPSVTGIWQSADWFEREAFDLFGIVFEGHRDLRRILTDYGFIGHPFRKDFPLSGKVEVRYDESRRRVAYQPVSIEPRTLVPRVIRDDNRYRPELRSEPDGSPGGGERQPDG